MANRRAVLRHLAVALLLPLGWPGRSHATPERMAEAIRQATGGAPVRPGRVFLELPAIAENGNSVALTVRVDSPMTAAEYVQTIHVFAEKNPLPTVAQFELGPRSGRAQVATRIRLADSQRVVALARLSDGSFWSGSAEIVVTIAACGG
jgi:sulfur-oxidizing protein SoxY